MFTGIVKGIFPVARMDRKQDFMTLFIQLTPELCEGLEIGASVAVNGVCLTVTSISEQNQVSFDVIQETLRVTNLGELSEGSLVNIERAARFGDEIGGHLLSGHIHDQVTVTELHKTDSNTTVVMEFDARWADYIQPKGYVSLNGASLTLGDEVAGNQFRVHLIPETLRLTTFGDVQVGSRINLEIDSQTQAVVNTVKKYLKQS